MRDKLEPGITSGVNPERASAVVAELCANSGIPARQVTVAETLPLGFYIYPSSAEIKLRADWLARIDEGQLKFALASTLALEKRSSVFSTKNPLMNGAMWISALACFGAYVGGAYLSAAQRVAAWIVAVSLALLTCIVPTVMMSRGAQALAFEEGLRVTRDYQAARRYVADCDKWNGPLSRFKPNEKQLKKSLDALDTAARKLGLL